MQAYLNHLSIYLPQEIRTNADISREHPEWSVEKYRPKLALKHAILLQVKKLLVTWHAKLVNNCSMIIK